MIKIWPLCVGFLLLFSACEQKDAVPEPIQQQSSQDEQETDLPPGVREDWIATLNKAIETRLSFVGNWVVFDHFREGRIYWPRQGVGFRCGGWLPDVSLIYASASEEIGDTMSQLTLVSAIAARRAEDDGDTVSSEAMEALFGLPAPDLVVDAWSPAAKELMIELCAILAERLTSPEIK